MKAEIQCDRAEQPWQMSSVQQNIRTNKGKGRGAGDTKTKGLREPGESGDAISKHKGARKSQEHSVLRFEH